MVQICICTRQIHRARWIFDRLQFDIHHPLRAANNPAIDQNDASLVSEPATEQSSPDNDIHPPPGAVNKPVTDQNDAFVESKPPINRTSPDSNIHPPLRAVNDPEIDQNDASLVSETVTE